MPPKKAPAGKAEVKKKEKLVEDKTFGLKNKKGAKNQKFIQHVQKNTMGVPKPNEAKLKKEEKKNELDELKQIFKPVMVAQKVEQGVDPKSILCAFFKQGTCGKGAKCKFSHDLAIERKSVKKSAYVDVRDEDTMNTWDEAKLSDVIEKKHGELERKQPKTDIICKYFLEALENSKYGWFWECPNGGNTCHYRHCLPPGFVLKKDQKKEKKEEISIEELVERERAKLGYNVTKVTLGSFLDWKKRKIEEKIKKSKDDQDKKKAEFKAGRHVGLSGKDMFTFNPDMITDEATEDGEAAFDNIREDLDEEDVKELDLEKLAQFAKEVDDTGTVVQDRHFQLSNGGLPAPLPGTSSEATKFDEDLFAEEEDLDELEKELDALDVEDE
ncbi:Zinc finger CCCH domain-containing protein 15 -like protein [Halotydeus destructor]|nr:Zinc finger CCCH domain-containing protein 15 -like protein [Halotydeus destructor]